MNPRLVLGFLYVREGCSGGSSIIVCSCAVLVFSFDVRTFQRIQHTHTPTTASGISSNFDFIGLGDGGSGLFSVRLKSQ